MKSFTILATVLALGAWPLHAELGFPSHYERTELVLAPATAFGSGLYGFDNPAAAALPSQSDLAIRWYDRGEMFEPSGWGAFGTIVGPSNEPVRSGVALGVQSRDFEGSEHTEIRLAQAIKTPSVSLGLSYGWQRGDAAAELDLGGLFGAGGIVRPNQFASLGLFGNVGLASGEAEGVAELGVRPLGNELLTLFGDVTADTAAGLDEYRWSAGAAVEPMPGVRFTGRYLDERGFTAGVQVSLRSAGAEYQAHVDSDLEHSRNSYAVRLGAYDRNVIDSYLARDGAYARVDLRGGMRHQRLGFFDGSPTVRRTLEEIDEARRDTDVAGVVVDMRGTTISASAAWEVRSALERFRQQGGRVVVYVERGGMSVFHIASIADRLVMHPEGGFSVPGYVAGSTYLADFFEAAGVGVDELREFAYKSGAETLSRREMSDEEREQRADMIDEYYTLTRDDVTASRGLSADEYDEIIRDGLQLTAGGLRKLGLVDSVAREGELSDVIEELEGAPLVQRAASELPAFQYPDDDYWGTRPTVAVVYAVGTTQIESGMHARRVAEAIRNARRDPNVVGVVLRVDSPGGDPLAADLVAEELRKTSEEKPTVVSQAGVAASGGYWVGMYADHKLAAPNTVTGSIGVIATWLYDDGVSDLMRVATDHVARGESADLGFGPSIPLLGIQLLPSRALTERERGLMVDYLYELYDRFVEKVAEGRDMEAAQAEELAQGRVWTGRAAQERDLVDILGGIDDAVELVLREAGLSPEHPYTVTESPAPPAGPWMQATLLGALGMENRIEHVTPALPGAGLAVADADLMKAYVDLLMERSGDPLVVLPFEHLHQHYLLEAGN